MIGMADTNQAEIYQLITNLRARSDRTYEEVRGLMADYLGI